jgi:quercetin dioxygenase-like cupin family protein
MMDGRSALPAFHTHHGIELGYVMDGEGELLVKGQPARPIKVGDSWTIAAGVARTPRLPPASF